ncbi:fungal specific transcription factor domain-containing protein [Aspergillus fijiensis CBS 313.89]|uniref:Zn(II)2Cys6 transcription factor n=1 Tax=Aspergillus fijiensis CBS 313.89 TaxID=1448319 RepID=A0A8G1RI94_9EURO|nr:Zn(II)2Cys6 transcription factor [Aspergillus fijiensis CBS 313.89]RAK72265.1 Zn(II)2Cys6 transcription factor [Aspergillus fijiensis CBS 313.89]
MLVFSPDSGINGFQCDGVVPVCGGCQRARVDCIEGWNVRDISRSHVAELEIRIEWLESIIQEHLPHIDLSKFDSGHLNHPRSSEYGVSTSSATFQTPVPQTAHTRDGWNPARDVTDQLGLVSVNAWADLRYLGPSSGLFFTRFVLTGLERRAEIARESPPASKNDQFVPAELLDIQPKDLPSDLKQAHWLTQAYFQAVHLQFPFLHRSTHLELLQKAYSGVDVTPIDHFQIFMVLAIGATIRSRQAKVLLSAEGYCASAILHLDAVFHKSSLRGVQSMLLLQMYTINNPTSGISLWTLHYNSLAAVMELGLHRNVQGSAFTEFDQEMRTRAFWCVYMMDRYLSTLLGRSIGLIDEQCDLRLPREINDEDLKPNQEIPAPATGAITDMSSAIHLFKLARFNAEIKCVLYCVDRNYPPYTQPAITDVKEWQEDMLNRLRQWKSSIPCHPPDSPACYLNDLLEIKYYELVMLVVRPSPLFNHPSRSLIRQCFHCALECIRLYHKLYVNSMLHYNWMNVQSLFLCVVTIFYCVWAPDGVGDETDLDTVLHALKSASDILSATGEYWLEAKRSRDVLDGITRATVRRFALSLARAGQSSPSHPGGDIHRSPGDQRIAGLNSLDTGAYAAGIGQAEQILLDPYYVPTQQPAATSELLSFFAGLQSDTTLDWWNLPWDLPGGMGDMMQNMVSGGQ